MYSCATHPEPWPPSTPRMNSHSSKHLSLILCQMLTNCARALRSFQRFFGLWSSSFVFNQHNVFDGIAYPNNGGCLNMLLNSSRRRQHLPVFHGFNYTNSSIRRIRISTVIASRILWIGQFFGSNFIDKECQYRN